MNPEGYRIRWSATFELPAPADEDTWYRGARGMAVLVDLLAATSLWPHLHVFGIGYEPGAPIADVAALRDALGSGPEVYTFAHGGARGTVFTNEAQLAVRADVSPSEVELQFDATGDLLGELGARFLDDVVGVIVGVNDAWSPRAHLARCSAWPTAAKKFVYPRTRPPRVATGHRPTSAIVDIVPTGPAPDGVDADAAAESRAIAAAPVPPGVERREERGLAILRWVRDPSDAAAVADAAGRHEQWLAPLIETEILSGWNERGDQSLPISGRQVAPFRAIEDGETGYLDVALTDGAVADSDWQRIEELATTKPHGITRLRLVLPTRDAALLARSRARDLGIDRVLYVDGSTLWDPDPPGSWLQDTNNIGQS